MMLIERPVSAGLLVASGVLLLLLLVPALQFKRETIFQDED